MRPASVQCLGVDGVEGRVAEAGWMDTGGREGCARHLPHRQDHVAAFFEEPPGSSGLAAQEQKPRAAAGKLLVVEGGSGGLGEYTGTGHDQGGQTVVWLCPSVGLSRLAPGAQGPCSPLLGACKVPWFLWTWLPRVQKAASAGLAWGPHHDIHFGLMIRDGTIAAETQSYQVCVITGGCYLQPSPQMTGPPWA